MKKPTKELLNELRQASGITDYLDNNKDELYSAELKTHLEMLLENKGVSKSEAIAKSGLHQIYAYQIFSGKKSPSRDKLIGLCFGMSLTLEESNRLLKIAGLSELYPRIRRDSIIIFAINKHLSITECNELLYDQEEYTLD